MVMDFEVGSVVILRPAFAVNTYGVTHHFLSPKHFAGSDVEVVIPDVLKGPGKGVSKIIGRIIVPTAG
jgi:hypothetical protein